MATYTHLDVLAADKAGDELIALMVGSDTQAADGFDFPNDGNCVILVLDELAAGAGDDFLLGAINDPFGRPEATLTRTITAKKIYVYGPFLPLIWNQSDGTINFKFTTHDAKTRVIVIRIANPT